MYLVTSLDNNPNTIFNFTYLKLLSYLVTFLLFVRYCLRWKNIIRVICG